MEKKILNRCPIDLNGLEYIVGIDEVGRGSFAGPVVVGAVILPINFSSELIRDSKKLSAKQREKAFEVILENAIGYSVQAGSVKEINKYGIEKATTIATEKCLKELQTKFNLQYIIADGNHFDNPIPNIPYMTIVKGDDVYSPIAAASILAKVKRDNYMVQLSEIYPNYDFANNKGYNTKKHGEGLILYGSTSYHRKQYVETWKKNQK